MRRLDERDEGWFTGMYDVYYLHIVNYGRRRALDLDAAADLAQEVFVVAWRRRREVPGQSLPWLYGVARRLLANRRRAGRIVPEPLPAADLEYLADRQLDRHDRAAELADVRTALARLSEPDREILRLVGWEELTVTEAAEVLGCTRATAAVRLHRARRRLVRAMAESTTTEMPAVAPMRP